MPEPLKKKPKKPTLRQAIAIKEIVASRGKTPVQRAMREAGYDETTIKNPKNLTDSIAYKDVLAAAGLTDDFLAKGTRELAEASTLKEYTFPHTSGHLLVPESTKGLEEGEEPKMKEERTLTPISDKEIKKIIGKVKGAVLVHIIEHNDRKIAYFTVPEHQGRRAGLDMGHKARGLYAAEKTEFILPKMSEQEKEEVEKLFKNL